MRTFFVLIAINSPFQINKFQRAVVRNNDVIHVQIGMYDASLYEAFRYLFELENELLLFSCRKSSIPDSSVKRFTFKEFMGNAGAIFSIGVKQGFHKIVVVNSVEFVRTRESYFVSPF